MRYDCIGNLQILAFEDNRSKSDKEQSCSQEDDLRLALIKDGNECKCFIKSTDDFNDLTQAKEFIEASKSRMIRIYREWWNDLEIEKLIPPSDNNKT